jgi:hypothetical protein
MESNFVVVALAGIVAVTILVVVAWKFGSSGETADVLPNANLVDPNTTTETNAGETEPPDKAPSSKPKLAKFVLSAARGDCWIRVRVGSAAGELLYQGTLEQGQTQRFAKWKRLFIELGPAAYLDARLNGRPVQNLPDGPSIIRVTPDGVRVVTTA